MGNGNHVYSSKLEIASGDDRTRLFYGILYMLSITAVPKHSKNIFHPVVKSAEHLYSMKHKLISSYFLQRRFSRNYFFVLLHHVAITK